MTILIRSEDLRPAKIRTPLMFAYGSNLNKEQMSRRCPAARDLGRLRLPDWQLVFRGVADVIREPGAACYGGVWRITPQCERALDRYEAYLPNGNGIYRKEYIPIKPTPDGVKEMMVYVMNSSGIYPPSEWYLQSIEEGYRDFRMPKAAYRKLDQAVWESWAEKAPTNIERERHRRKGRPVLAVPNYEEDPENELRQADSRRPRLVL